MNKRIYVWLFLMIDIIEQSRSKYVKSSSIESLLADLSLEVSDAYEKILTRSSDRELAKKLLAIIVAASRPLTLVEMNAALTLATQDPTSKSLEGLDLWPETDFLSTVKNICGLLVTVYDNRLLLLHQTARDFLLVKPKNSSLYNLDQWRGCLNLASSNSLLCRVCIDYLTLRGFLKPSHGRQGAEDKGSKSDDSKDQDSTSEVLMNGELRREVVRPKWMDSLLAYSACFWHFHYRSHGEEQRLCLQNTAAELCDARQGYFHTWLWVYSRENPTGERIESTWSKAGVAAYFDLADSVKKYLTSCIFHDSWTYDTVELLIEKGANANATARINGTALQILC